MTPGFRSVVWGKKALKLALLAPSAFGRIREPGLFVLVYHRVGAGMGREMDLPTDLFEAQLHYLGERFEPVPLADGLGRLAAGETLRRDLVAVTFDDGYKEVYAEAWPVLREAGIPATIFVATGFLDGDRPAPLRAGAGGQGSPPEPITWEQIGEMMASGLIAVGSHSHSHADFERISKEEAEMEAALSKDIVERRVGERPEIFAYPRAIVAHEDVIARHYRYAVAADGTKNLAKSFDPYRVSRTPVRASDGMFFFRRRLDGIRPLEDRVYDRMRAEYD